MKDKIAQLRAENLDKELKVKNKKKISMKDLHLFETLAKDVEKRLSKMGITDRAREDDSSGYESSESSSSTDEEQRRRSKKRGNKRVKSGKSAKIASRVICLQIWPHSELTLGYVSKDVKYDDLTIEEFVAGYSAILSLSSLSDK